MRLRPLTEAECYARCYGGHTSDRVSVLRASPRPSSRRDEAGERLRELFEERLDARPVQEEAA